MVRDQKDPERMGCFISATTILPLIQPPIEVMCNIGETHLSTVNRTEKMPV